LSCKISGKTEADEDWNLMCEEEERIDLPFCRTESWLGLLFRLLLQHDKKNRYIRRQIKDKAIEK
jgi:hypothetical protein